MLCSFEGDEFGYLIADNTDASDSSLVGFRERERERERGRGGWGAQYRNLRFVQKIYDWELEEVDSLMDLLYSNPLFSRGTD